MSVKRISISKLVGALKYPFVILLPITYKDVLEKASVIPDSSNGSVICLEVRSKTEMRNLLSKLKNEQSELGSSFIKLIFKITETEGNEK